MTPLDVTLWVDSLSPTPGGIGRYTSELVRGLQKSPEIRPHFWIRNRLVPDPQLLEWVQEISGHAMDVQVNPAFVRAQEVRVLAGSPARLESAVGPVPHRSLDDTLAWMLAD